MKNDTNKRQVPVTNRHSGETRMSEPVPLHAPRQEAGFVTPAASEQVSQSEGEPSSQLSPLPQPVEPPNEQKPSGAVGPDTEQAEATQLGQAADSDPLAEGVQKAAGNSKIKVNIDTLEKFIDHAYSRKGKHLGLKSKVEKAIAQNPRLDNDALSRLLTLAEGDTLLAVPRQLLLASREIEGYPALRDALSSFVSTVMSHQPMFADAGVQAALRNLPGAPTPAEALEKLVAFCPSETEGKDPVKGADLQTLRQNAANLFVTWLANNRSMNLEELAALLFQVVWHPAARELTDDNARLRALTEMERAAGVGLACLRFRQKAIEASTSRDQALRDANHLRSRLAETEDQRSSAQKQRDALQSELEALSERMAVEMAELRRAHDVERTHLHHGQEQLGGRLVRRLEDAVETLEVGLRALHNKTPRVEVMVERAELVVDALRAEIQNLREE